MSDRDYVFRLRGEAEQLIAAHERAATAVDKHADQTALLARQQAIAHAEADRFIAGLKRQADAIGKTRSEMLAMQAAEMGVSDRAAPLIARLQAGEKAAGGFARTGKMTAVELQQVGYQLNDLAVQVASGQNPLTALVQQGSQLSGTFGGVRPAVQAVFSLFTPARVAVGGLAAGIGLLAAAWVQADSENSRFNKGLALTGNAAGQTRGTMDALARSTAANAQITIGSSREIAQALVDTGKVGSKAIEPMALAIARVQKLTGDSAESVVKDFATMSSGVARWAAEHNKQYNYLTVDQYRYIRGLEAQGKTEEAMAENARLLNDALGKRTVQVGLLEKGWDGIKRAASGAWDAMLGIGRAETVEEQLADVQRRLALPAQRGRNPLLADQRQEALRQREAELQELQRLERRSAALQADQAKANSKAIEDEQQASVSARLAIQKAGWSASRATQEVELEQQRIELERSYDQGEKSLAEYVKARQQIEARGIALKEASVDQEIALEERRKGAAGSQPERQQSEARIGELRAQRIALQSERLKLTEEARKNFGLKPKTDDLGDFINERVMPADAQRARDRDRALEELRLSSKQLAVSVIADDRRRGEAQIALEEEQLRQKMKLHEWYGDDLRRAEDELAAWRAARERQLTDSLKPEWQRRLEEWEDVERSRQKASDQVNLAFVEGGRKAFGDMLASGKANFGDLKQFALRTLGEMLYERSGIGRSFALLGDLAFKGVTSGLNALFPGVGGGQSFATPASGFIGGAVPWAKGGAFAGSDLSAHRDTVVHKPTLFRFAKGARMGLMGEEGSEAIMPLVRSASGHLGVRAMASQTSAPVVQPIIIENHGADVQQQPDPSGAMRLIVRTAVNEVDGRLAGGGSTARAAAGRFGLNNGAALSRRRG
jgi:lambda family phage tail tape measure protein